EKEEEEPDAEDRPARDPLRSAGMLKHPAESLCRHEVRDLLLPLPRAIRRQRADEQAERRQPEPDRRDDSQVLPEQRRLDSAHGAPCRRELRRARPSNPNSAAGRKKRAYHSSYRVEPAAS